MGIASRRIRRRLADADGTDRACAAIDAIVRAERYLDANVNLAIVMEQLSGAV